VEAVEADQFARVVDLDVATLERRRAFGLGWGGIAGDQRQSADPPVEAVPPEDPPDALGLIRMPPQRSWASVALIRRGPSPGCPRAKARTRCSVSWLVWLGIRGGRRSRGRSISRPERRTGPRQR
jgi:hypothetical protein